MLRELAPAAALLALAAGCVLYARLLPLSLPGVNPAARADLEYDGADGRAHVYLGDYDSYLWLRHARTLLGTGTPCDAVDGGACLDTYAAAPVGQATRYARSLHVYALAGLHRVMSQLDPGAPLHATAYWLPVLVGVLGVLPAFAIGRCLGGWLAGLAAAVMIGLNPLFLGRSLGADNDVWNVVLPLFAVWGGMTALGPSSLRRRAAAAALAGAAVVLHAAAWSGWLLTMAVLTVGMVAGALFRIASALRRGRHSGRAGSEGGIVLAVFIGVVVVGAAAVGEGGALGAFPGTLIGRVGLGSGQAAPAPALPWPDVLTTVGELSTPGLGAIAASLEGQRYFFVAWLGVLLLVLPSRRWEWWHFGVLLAGNFLYAVLLTTPGLAPHTVVGLAAAPLGAAVVLGLVARRAVDDEADAARLPAALIVVVWFLATLHLAYSAVRLVMLLVPPCGIAFGVALGRLDAWLARVLLPRTGGAARWLRPVLAVVVGLALVAPVQGGLAAASRYTPRINDAWWDTLAHLRESTPSNSIVTTWWDYGHWVKYVAERPTSMDGSTLQTHVPHWVGRLLLAATEEESVGLLRMLNCASDVDGRGAWARLVAHGLEPAAAYRAVIEIARRDRAAAAAWLAARGLAAEPVRDVLERTHCAAPPSYLVLTSRMIEAPAWRQLGGWDPVRSWLAGLAPDDVEAAGASVLEERFGVAAPDARALVAEHAAILQSGDADALGEFVRPRLAWFVRGWLACAPRAGAWTCGVGHAIDRRGTRLDAVLVDPLHPERVRLRVRRRGASTPTEGGPAALLVAGQHGLAAVQPLLPPIDRRVAVLVDLRMRRVLIGSPDVIRSTFTHLFFLEGRYASRFTRVDDRRSYRGERVVTWQVRTADDTGDTPSRAAP